MASATDVPIEVSMAATFPSVVPSIVLALATDVPEEVLIALVTMAAAPIEVPMAAVPSVVVPSASAGVWTIPLATTADVAMALCIATTQPRPGRACNCTRPKNINRHHVHRMTIDSRQSRTIKNKH